MLIMIKQGIWKFSFLLHFEIAHLWYNIWQSWFLKDTYLEREHLANYFYIKIGHVIKYHEPAESVLHKYYSIKFEISRNKTGCTIRIKTWICILIVR